MKKRKKVITASIVSILVVITTIFIISNLTDRATPVMAQDILMQQISVEKTNLSRTFSTSGVVRSADTQNVFSNHSNRPVREIFVSVGDYVEAGDILAILDMSNIENDIAQTELNLINAQRNVSEEERTNTNSVTNARTSVDSARISLERQQQNALNAERDFAQTLSDIEEPFDTYMFERVIIDASVNLERRRNDFLEAQEDLFTVIYNFDDYHHQNAINEAQIMLNRRLSDLEEAENQLDEEVRTRAETFDATNFQNAINDAERNLERRRNDEVTAQQNLFSLWHQLSTTPPEAQNSLLNQISTAQTNIDNSRRAVEDAELALERARNDLTRARNNHNDNASELRDNAISSAERGFNNAQNAVDDAQRNLDRAISDLDRAKSDAETNASNRLTTAINNYNDAQRTFDRAVSDKNRAIEDSFTTNENRLNSAERSLNDSKNQLQSAQNSLRSAQESLNQASERPVASITNVEMQQINLDRLNAQLAEGVIIAPSSGVVTAINASVGATASGVLFIIEDTSNLYVSANIREHSLVDLMVGQPAFVTTEVTGNRMYDAELSFISPRSVSPMGSTNVEFEIHAAMLENDSNVRIGMNAFIEVILDSSDQVFAVPISAVISTERGSFIVVLEGDEMRQIPVRVGLRTSTHVEIISDDLYEGKMILARPALAISGLNMGTNLGLGLGGRGNMMQGMRGVN